MLGLPAYIRRNTLILLYYEIIKITEYHVGYRSVMLSNLDLLNKLAENEGTLMAAGGVEKIESEHVDYVSTKGFIEDIDAVENENTKRIEKEELKDEHIQWLEEKLASINEEFNRRAGIPLPSED
jgi:DNA recombination-dependent growth factor C